MVEIQPVYKFDPVIDCLTDEVKKELVSNINSQIGGEIEHLEGAHYLKNQLMQRRDRLLSFVSYFLNTECNFLSHKKRRFNKNAFCVLHLYFLF